MRDAATSLADWIRLRYDARREPMTHLKLHKLLFYCYGAASAKDLEHSLGVGGIVFEPWEHGPVVRSVWRRHRDAGREPIPPPARCVTRYPADVEAEMGAALAVYGCLDAWSLRNESHMEQPWIEAYARHARRIPDQAIKAHFKRKFAAGRVCAPVHLFDPGSFLVDAIPILAFASLVALATALSRTG